MHNGKKEQALTFYVGFFGVEAHSFRYSWNIFRLPKPRAMIGVKI
jgi:hypothetical protein